MKKPGMPPPWVKCTKKSHGYEHGWYTPGQFNKDVQGCWRCHEEAERLKAGKCLAILGHGPGHQSKTYCEVIGPHEVHECSYSGGDARWKGPADKMKFSGYFDEPPWTDDDDQIRMTHEKKLQEEKKAKEQERISIDRNALKALCLAAAAQARNPSDKRAQGVFSAIQRIDVDMGLKTS